MERHGYRVAIGGEPTGLGSLLPPGVIAVEAIGAVDPDPLFPGEVELIAKAIRDRQLEFARGRSCARRALAELGLAARAVLATSRAPIWPPGVVGSITHCRDYCAAAVAFADRWSGLGIDAEVMHELEPSVERRIVLPSERARLAALAPSRPWSCVIFSIKEAIYKATYPRTHQWLDFHDVDVCLDVAAGRFIAQLLVDSPALAMIPRSLEGCFAFDSGRVHSTAALPS